MSHRLSSDLSRADLPSSFLNQVVIEWLEGYAIIISSSSSNPQEVETAAFLAASFSVRLLPFVSLPSSRLTSLAFLPHRSSSTTASQIPAPSPMAQQPPLPPVVVAARFVALHLESSDIELNPPFASSPSSPDPHPSSRTLDVSSPYRTATSSIF